MFASMMQGMKTGAKGQFEPGHTPFVGGDYMGQAAFEQVRFPNAGFMDAQVRREEDALGNKFIWLLEPMLRRGSTSHISRRNPNLNLFSALLYVYGDRHILSGRGTGCGMATLPCALSVSGLPLSGGIGASAALRETVRRCKSGTVTLLMRRSLLEQAMSFSARGVRTIRVKIINNLSSSFPFPA